MPSTSANEDSSNSGKSGLVSSNGKSVDKSTYRYSSENLSDWNLYQLILTELFADKKLTYLLSQEEIAKRKQIPTPPQFIEYSGAPGTVETQSAREKRLYEQSLITDDFKEKKKKAEKKREEMDDDFEAAINVVLGSVDKDINLALHKTLATIQHLSAEDRFTAIRQEIEVSFGPNSARDVQGLMDQLTGLNIDQLTPKIFLQEFNQIVGTLERIQQRDLDGKPIRAPLPPLPDNEPPNPELPTTTRQECRAYCMAMYKAWKERRDKYPDGGPIRTYRPETSQLRGYLTAAMAKSKIPKVQHYNHSLLLPENALKSYDEIYKALRVIGEDCAKDAISRAIANGRDKSANQGSGGSGAKAINSLTSTGSKRGQGANSSGPAAGIKCRNCGDNHYATACPSRTCFACKPVKKFDSPEARRKHYQDVHGKSKKDRANHGRGSGDKKGRKDHSRDKKRDRSGERGTRNTDRDSDPEPTTSHAPNGSSKSSRSTSPKPPKKVNLAHSVTDDRGESRRRPRDGYSDESSSDQESRRGYRSSDDDERQSRKRSRDVRHINVVTRVPRSLEKSDPRTYEEISGGALLIPAIEPRVPRVIPIRDEAPAVPSSLEKESTEGATAPIEDTTPGSMPPPSAETGAKTEPLEGPFSLARSERPTAKVNRKPPTLTRRSNSDRPGFNGPEMVRHDHRIVQWPQGDDYNRWQISFRSDRDKNCYSSGGSTPPRDAARIRDRVPKEIWAEINPRADYRTLPSFHPNQLPNPHNKFGPLAGYSETTSYREDGSSTIWFSDININEYKAGKGIQYKNLYDSIVDVANYDWDEENHFLVREIHPDDQSVDCVSDEQHLEHLDAEYARYRWRGGICRQRREHKGDEPIYKELPLFGERNRVHGGYVNYYKSYHEDFRNISPSRRAFKHKAYRDWFRIRLGIPWTYEHAVDMWRNYRHRNHLPIYDEREQYTDSLNHKEEQRLETADTVVGCMVNLMKDFIEGVEYKFINQEDGAEWFKYSEEYLAIAHRNARACRKIDYDEFGIADEPPRRPMTKAKFLLPPDATLKRRERSISPEPRTVYGKSPIWSKLAGQQKSSQP